MIASTDRTLIRETLVAVSDGSHRFGYVFYRRLFEALPEVRPMFRGDISAQVDKFMGMLQAIPLALELPEELGEMLRDLGRQHARFGVRDEHYAPTAAAMIASLAELCGDAWTDESAAAWQRLLTAVTGEMIAGAATATVDA